MQCERDVRSFMEMSMWYVANDNVLMWTYQFAEVLANNILFWDQ